jgi:hypothetical protein
MPLPDASAAVFDLSIKFEGRTEAVFAVTAAAASSMVNGSSSALVYVSSKPAKPSADNRKIQVMQRQRLH